MTNQSRLLDSALATHWAITREGLDSLATIYRLAASRDTNVTIESLAQVLAENEELGHSLHLQSYEALEAMKGQQMSGTHYGRLYENGIATIDLIGPIFPRANMFTLMSGATSIAQFANDFIKIEANEDVRGVVINIDSPGGDVRGIGDAAKVVNMVTRASKKPIQVFASGFMASAAYYVGSAVGPGYIISTESGLIGSIGVVLTAKAKSKDDIEIVSSQSPYKRADPSTEEGRAPYQQQVDDLAKIFVKDVSSYRKVTITKVLSDYGQGAVLVAPRAMKQGLVDRIGTLSEVVEEMAKSKKRRYRAEASEGSDSTAQMLLQFDEENTNMGLKDMLARFNASNKSLIEDEQEQGQSATAGGTEPDVASEAPETPTPPATPIAASDDVAIDPAVTAQAQKPTREELEERFSDGAELFATQMVLASRVFPAQSAYAASMLLTARIDDVLIGGSIRFVDEEGQLAEGTREASVRALYMAMPKHTMTQQAIAGIRSGSVNGSVLAETDKTEEDAPATPERKAHLLGTSQQGQAVLAQANSK